MILNRAKDYYKDDKERLRGQAKDKNRNLSQEEKSEKRKYGRYRYHNMSEENKRRTKEYQKNYLEAKKFDFFSFHSIKIKQEVVCFEKIASLKALFIKNKRSININKVDIKRTVLSDKKSNGKDSFKYFIGYRHEGNVFPSPLCIKLRQMNAFAT